MMIIAEDKKKIGVIALAVAAGLIATILVGNHIQGEINAKTEILSKEFEKSVKPLQQEVQQLRAEVVEVRTRAANAPAAVAGGAPGDRSAPIAPYGSLALKTPPGKRAITIQIDSLSAVGGLINPGDFVDVMAQLNVPQEAGGALKPINGEDVVTAMIFQNVQILAVNTNLSVPGLYESQQAAPTLKITVALDPEEAGLMSFVEKNGKLRLAVRSPTETESHMLQASNWQTLSDYVLEKQGMEMNTPRSKSSIEPSSVQEVQPYIQIFRGGREL